MDLQEIVNQLGLEKLDKDWVDTIWQASFTDEIVLPVEYNLYLQNVDISNVLSCAIKFLEDFISSRLSNTDVNNSTSNRNSSFVTNDEFEICSIIIGNDIHRKSLLCLLSAFLLEGKANFKNENERELCLQATSLYLLILSIPASSVNDIFNTVLYFHAVEVLDMCTLIKSNEISDVESISNNEPKILFIESFHSLLIHLTYLLKTVSFKDKEESLILTIRTLAKITNLDMIQNLGPFEIRVTEYSLDFFPKIAYTTLKTLCSTKHGDISTMIEKIMFKLNEVFPININGKICPKYEQNIKGILSFICDLLDSFGKQAYKGVKFMYLKLILKISNHSDERAKLIKLIFSIIDSFMSIELFCELIYWVIIMCFKPLYEIRIKGLDVLNYLFFTSENLNRLSNNLIALHEEDDGQAISNTVKCLNYKILLSIVFSLCRDKSVWIKAKALQILKESILLNNTFLKSEIENIFINPFIDKCIVDFTNMARKPVFNIVNFISNTTNWILDTDPLPDALYVVDLIRSCINNERVIIRKPVFELISNICVLSEKWITSIFLQMLLKSCVDLSKSIRASSVQNLTKLVIQYPENVLLFKYWTKGILPLLSDPDDKVKKKAIEAFRTLVLDNIVPYSETATEMHLLPWKLLEGCISERGLHSYILVACLKLFETNEVESNLIEKLYTHVGTENNTRVWYLLRCLTNYIDLSAPAYVNDYFYENVLYDIKVDLFCAEQVLHVLKLNCVYLDTMNQLLLITDMLQALNLVNVPVTLIQIYIEICQIITKKLAETEVQVYENTSEWATKLIRETEKNLEKHINQSHSLDEDMVLKLIMLVGELNELCSYTVADTITNYLIDRLADPDSAENVKLKAFSVITLGKLCLPDENMCRRMLPLFVRQLQSTDHRQVKINIFCVLTDLFFSFAVAVEAYLPVFYMSLRDPNDMVKHHTFGCLRKIVQEGYLKIRTPLYFYLFALHNDNDDHLKKQLTTFITYCVVKQNKNIILHNFVASILFYNDYEDHPLSHNYLATANEKRLFSLAGPEKSDERLRIYKYMLAYLKPDEKLRLMNKLCEEVINGLTSNKNTLKNKDQSILRDTFSILTCDEIQPIVVKNTNVVDDEQDGTEDEDSPREKVTKSTKSLILEAKKRNTINNIVPSFSQFFSKLKQIRSSFYEEASQCFTKILQDYKDEIEDILSHDEELAAEICFIMKNRDRKNSSRRSDQRNSSTHMRISTTRNIVTAPDIGSSSRNVGQQPTVDATTLYIQDAHQPWCPAPARVDTTSTGAIPKAKSNKQNKNKGKGGKKSKPTSGKVKSSLEGSITRMRIHHTEADSTTGGAHTNPIELSESVNDDVIVRHDSPKPGCSFWKTPPKK